MRKKGCHTHSNIHNCIYMWQTFATENTSEFRNFLQQNTIRGGGAPKWVLYINIKRAHSSFPLFTFVLIYWIHIQSGYISVGWLIGAVPTKPETQLNDEWYAVDRTQCPIHLLSLSSALKCLILSNFSEASSVLMES